MSTPRRQIIRPILNTAPTNPQHRQIQRQRHRLDTERAALTRWMGKLRRAFHVVEKLQRSVTRLERKISQLERAQ